MTIHPQSTDSEQDSQQQPPAPPQETLGHYLQHARIHKNITLESVAATTCIHIATLQALEADDHDNLPADVFVRGFVKIYASHLGLDPQKALSLHLPAASRRPPDYSAERQGRDQHVLPGSTMARERSLSPGRKIGLLILLLILAGISYLSHRPATPPPATPEPERVQQESTAPPATTAEALPPATPEKSQGEAATTPVAPATGVLPASPEAPASGNTVSPPPTVESETTAPPQEGRLVIAPSKRKIQLNRPAPAPSSPSGDTPPPAAAAPQPVATPPAPPVAQLPRQKAPQPAMPATAAAMAGSTAPPATPGLSAALPATAPATAAAYLLVGNFTELTWLQVQVDDGPVRDYTFRTGEQWEWRADHRIQLHIGNAGGAHLTLNGKTLPPLGASGTTVRLTLPTMAGAGH